MANEQNAASDSPKMFPGLQGQPAAAAPSLPKTTPGTMTEDSKNVFTELFGKDVSQKPGAMMNTVVEQQDKKNVSFFGNKPREALTLKKLTAHKGNPGSTFLQISVLLFVITASVFLTQNSSQFSWFGVNPALRVETFQSQVNGLNAAVRVQNYLAGALLLDQYVSAADAYLYNASQANSAYTSQNKKEEFLHAAANDKPQLIALLGKIQEKLNEDIPAAEIPAAVLVADNLIAELHAKKGQVDDQSLLQDVQDLQTAKALMQNQTFHDLVKTLTVADVTDEQIQSVFDNFNSLNASSNSIISTIKSARPEWATVLDELEGVIKTVDPLFGTEFPGNLTISNVVFNADGTVTVSGDTSTSDTTNFTLISNLMDALEKSDTFKNVADRTFAKTGTDTVYTGSFRVSMELENNPASND